jgi:MFS family permease
MDQHAQGKSMSSDAVEIRGPKDVVALVNAGVGKGPSFWVLLIALGGILTDAYDLISFGIGVPQVTSEFHLSPGQVATISASLSFGAIFGAWFGGYFIDKIGRLRMFMLDLVFS